MSKKTVLIIGNGGREHALGWKLKQSPQVGKIYFAPGNAGTSNIGESVNIGATDVKKLLEFAKKNKVDLTVVGPEAPLTEGIIDVFQKAKMLIFGPSQKAAQLEGSKFFTEKILEKYDIPRPESKTFTDPKKALIYCEKYGAREIVIKADGLAAGKGVILPETLEEMESAIHDIMVKKMFGESGSKVVIQERLTGQEISVFALCDGKRSLILPACQDHKRIFDDDQGPNTGGMGAYSPVPAATSTLMSQIKETIIDRTLAGMKSEGIPFTGVLFVGIMLTEKQPKVLEFNVRFGDPECEVLMSIIDEDLYPILDNCARGKLSQQTIKVEEGAVACVILAAEGYPESPKKGEIIHGLGKNKDVEIFHAGTSVNDNKIVTAGGRVLAVTSYDSDLKSALEKAYSVIGKDGVHFKGMQYRTDIGKKGLKKFKVSRVQVISKISDTRAEVRQKKLQELSVKKISIVDVYTIDKQLSDLQLDEISSALANPVNQKVSFQESLFPKKFDWAIEVGFLPGVTDNVAGTAKEIIEDLLKIKFDQKEGVYTSQITFVTGKLSKDEIEQIAYSLHNPLIQRLQIKSFKEFTKDKGMDAIVPQVKLHEKMKVDKVDLNISDEQLIEIGKKGIKNTDGTFRGPLALDLPYMKAIQYHFKKLKRKPTDIELESIAQTWSEHCKHTIFADPIDEVKDGLYKSFIKKATQDIRQAKGKDDICVSVFTDNSGAIAFDEKYLVTDKVETHNSPSALDPFGGAVTGIVGVNRDSIGFGLGAKPVINRYGFCFADPTDTKPIYKGKNKTQQMLAPRRIMDGVIDGVNSGGNSSGIPAPQGFVVFENRYKGKPLVFVGTIGLIPREVKGKKSYVKKAQPGDYIVMLGGRVGQDGIHGATFSSEAMDTGSPATAVQIGDPITQKKLSDAVVKEARDLGLYTSITDNGAGGLSCSVAEMAKECGGCQVRLEDIPLKYPGMSPWQIWISESQERMTLAVPPKSWNKFSELMTRRGVEATVIGEFTNSGKCIVTYKDGKIMDLEMQFLHDGLPPRLMTTTYTPVMHTEPEIPVQKDLTDDLITMLSRQNIASTEFISMQYDHEVQAGSVLKPLQGKGRVNADVTVTRPVLSSPKGVILSQSLYPAYSDIDTYHMAAASIDTAIRNAIAAGASLDHLALLDNFCWCSSNEQERLGQLKEAAKACYDYAVAYGTPFISGKDSMFNDFKGYDEDSNPIKISIPPTLLISAIGVMKDSTKAVSIDTKFPGDLVYILGETDAELGGSEYFAMYGEFERNEPYIGNDVPKVDAERNKNLYRALTKTIEKELIASAISVHRGGLAIALAKISMAGMLGIDISLEDLPGSVIRDEFALFSESQGRILVTVSPENQKDFEKTMDGKLFALIGKVTKDNKVIIKGRARNTIIKTDIKSLMESYKSTFKNY